MKEVGNGKRPGRCKRCSNFMNWARLWDNLWCCLGCGTTYEVGPRTTTYR